MELKDMKLSPQERKEMAEPTALGKGPEYPWGLQLRLSDEECAKLFSSLPDVGNVVTIQAKAKVTGVNQSDREGGEKSTSVELQITAMGVEPEKAEKDASEAMYSKA